MNHTSEQIKTKLEEVMDPELHMSIVDLGLVYEATPKENNKVHILMTLTTLGCPLFPVIESDIKSRLGDLGFKDEDITIELTFDPPWSMERMTERAKAMLGI
jgi:metal-sulfur cluster biosynthetic enzyme